jgi:hypothetical protein
MQLWSAIRRFRWVHCVLDPFVYSHCFLCHLSYIFRFIKNLS